MKCKKATKKREIQGCERHLRMSHSTVQSWGFHLQGLWNGAFLRGWGGAHFLEQILHSRCDIGEAAEVKHLLQELEHIHCVAWVLDPENVKTLKKMADCSGGRGDSCIGK